MNINKKIFWLSILMLILGMPSKSNYCQNLLSFNCRSFLNQDSIGNIVFMVSENKALYEKYNSNDGRIINMTCEVNFDFCDRFVKDLLRSIDTCYKVNDLIDNCWDSNYLYDSYLLIYLKNKKRIKIYFYCKKYNKGVIDIGDQYEGQYVVFNSVMTNKLKTIAHEIRKGMCPCSELKNK